MALPPTTIWPAHFYAGSKGTVVHGALATSSNVTSFKDERGSLASHSEKHLRAAARCSAGPLRRGPAAAVRPPSRLLSDSEGIFKATSSSEHSREYF